MMESDPVHMRGRDMATLFTKIINGDIPATFVYEDDLCVAFMDIQPLTTGHLLVVPREEVDHWVDLSDELSAHLFAVAKKIGRAQKQAFGCERVGVVIQGYEVPHVHIHLFPTNQLQDFDPRNKRESTAEEREEAAAKIRAELP